VEYGTAEPARSGGQGKTTRDDCIAEAGKRKVIELLEGGAAERKPGRRKLNGFAKWD
jgi:hypothetical protein